MTAFRPSSGWGRTVLAALIGLGLGVAAGTGQAQTAAPPPTKITIAVFTGSLQSLIPWVADAQGFYKANGLDPSILLTDVGTQMVTNVASRGAEFVTLAIDVMGGAVKRGLDVVLVSGNLTGNPFAVLVRKGVPLPNAGKYPDVVRDLKGLKWGVQVRGGSTELTLRAMAREAGLNVDRDMAWIPVGGPATALPALKNASIDLYIGFDPIIQVSTANGFATVAVDMRKGEGPADFQRVDYNGVWVLRSYLQQSPDVVRRFVKAQEEADCWAHDARNFDALVSLIKRNVPVEGLTDEQVRQMVRDNLPILGSTFQRSSIDKWNGLLVQNNVIPSPLDANQILWSGLPARNSRC
ncbi:MAG TPA: ABC transporter substrate-binding protein [Methylomirabilota bacterium]|nr:ABC transporter substrate-binding protein [Methylomirabilota bacterium]